LASVDVTKFQTTEAYSNLDLTNVNYGKLKQSREENLKVMEQIRPNSLCIQKIQNQHDFEPKKTSNSLILLVHVMTA
jgi:hypothetical protein